MTRKLLPSSHRLFVPMDKLLTGHLPKRSPLFIRRSGCNYSSGLQSSSLCLLHKQHSCSSPFYLSIIYILRDLSAHAFMHSMTLLRNPFSSSLHTPAMVVPAGEHTISLSSPGCFPVSSTILALPSTDCAAN